MCPSAAPSRAITLLACLLSSAACDDSGGQGVARLPEPPCTGNLVDRSSDVSNIHDPAIAREGDTFYVYSSSPLGSFYTSRDLRTWTAAGTVFDEIPRWLRRELPEANHIGSPDIEWFGGRWVMYYQSHIPPGCNAAMGVATNATLDPASPDYRWIDHGLVLRSVPTFPSTDLICGQDEVYFDAIDPTLFVDPADGKPWMLFGSTLGGLFLVDIDPETFRPTRHPRDFTLLAARPILQADPIIEAPYLVHRDGWYYLLFSHNRCCQGAATKYKILVGRSRDIAGPYVDRDGTPLLEEGGTVLIEREGSLIGTGHADVFSDGGFDYLVHHAYDAALDYVPVLNVRRLDWDEEGWPAACIAGAGDQPADDR